MPSFTHCAALPQPGLCTGELFLRSRISLCSRITVETPLCCPEVPVPWGARVPAPRGSLPPWPQEKLSLAVAKQLIQGLGCIQLLPAAPSKLLEGHAPPASRWRLNTVRARAGFTAPARAWHSTKCESAACAAARMARLPVPATEGSSCRQDAPLNADRSFALRVLLQTDVCAAEQPPEC